MVSWKHRAMCFLSVTVDVLRAVHYALCLWMQASWWRWKAQWCDCWCLKGNPLHIVFVNAGKLVTVKGTVVWLLMSQGQSTTHRVCECRQAGDGERHSGVTVDVSRAVHYTSCLWMQASWWQWKAQWCDCWCLKGSPLHIVFVNAGKLVTVKGTVVWLLMSQGQSTTHRVCECRQAGDSEGHSGVTVDVSRAVHYTSCLWMQASWWRWKAQWCVWVVSSRCVLTWRMSASVANTSRLLVACLPLL